MTEYNIIDELEVKENQEFEKASRGVRFINLLIDYIFIIFIMVLTSPFIFSSEDLDTGISSYLISALYIFLYYFIFEKMTNGKTLGKYITKTRAIDLDGEMLSTSQFFQRNLMRLMPFEVFSIFGNAPWHDSVADSQVIKEN